MDLLLYPERVNKIVYCVGAKLEVPVDDSAAARTAAGRNELIRLTKQFNADPSRDNVRARLNWLFRNPARDVTDELVDLRWALYHQRPPGRGGTGAEGRRATATSHLTCCGRWFTQCSCCGHHTIPRRRWRRRAPRLNTCRTPN